MKQGWFINELAQVISQGVVLGEVVKVVSCTYMSVRLTVHDGEDFVDVTLNTLEQAFSMKRSRATPKQ